jgi:hypothetical protein
LLGAVGDVPAIGKVQDIAHDGPAKGFLAVAREIAVPGQAAAVKRIAGSVAGVVPDSRAEDIALRGVELGVFVEEDSHLGRFTSRPANRFGTAHRRAVGFGKVSQVRRMIP